MEFFVIVLSPLVNLLKLFLLFLKIELSVSIQVLQLLDLCLVVFLLLDHSVFQFLVSLLHILLLVLYYLKPFGLIFLLSLVHSVWIQMRISIGETCVGSASTVAIIYFAWTEIVRVLELAMRFLVSCHTGVQTLVSFVWRNKRLLSIGRSKLCLEILAISCSKHFLLIRHAQVPIEEINLVNYHLSKMMKMNNLHDPVIGFGLRKNSLWTAVLVLNELRDLNDSSLSPEFMLADFNIDLCTGETD